MPTPYGKGMEPLRKLLAEVETVQNPDIDKGNNGLGGVLEEIFFDHDSFYEHDTESEKAGDSGNNDVIWNSFHQNRALSGEKQNLGRIFVVIILCRFEQKDQRKM
ncbi:hypothetical protein AVEN_1885-1 [Araneus ventricosus]|uniref:Uncharacterized protein n=1 Tax=Araneus ventricosus TaxID=182803 RepID=A0A4Y2G6S1_ARAVE|nr:hypothetical protein AVEN_1885-1 [Araneus ventricosus]